MEEEERPRKLQKVEHERLGASYAHAELGPVMTGAVGTSEEKPAVGDEGSNETPATSEKSAITETGGETPEITGAAPTLSRNQLKKLRRREKWEAGRDYRKAKRKEKVVAKRERKRATATEAGEDGDAAKEAEKASETGKPKNLQSTLVPITFVIDCNYDDLMLEKERISLSSQLTRSYSDNHKCPYGSHLVISSFDKLLKQRFDTVLAKTHEKWKGVRFMQEDYAHVAEMAKDWMKGPGGGKLEGVLAQQADAKPEDGEVIYLSSDSPNTLTELKPYSTYIIGGLVDKNRHKGICYKSAMEKGIKTAKLPIGEYIQMASRSVLATNHVVEIMLRWLELGDWGEAFMRVIPKRKGGVLKGEGSKGEGSQDGHKESEELEVAEDEDQPADDHLAQPNGES